MLRGRASMAYINVAIINASTVLRDSVVKAAVPALQTQVHRDFAPAWGIDADLIFVPNRAKPPARSWWLTIVDNADQAGALGYHDVTNAGLPLAKVFAGSDINLGFQWTVTASHELLEMLGDPDINLTAFVELNGDTGEPLRPDQPLPPGATLQMRLYAYEVCDACEADQYGYPKGDVLVSDFVFPAWFQ